jgi:hypothetical protein
VAFDGADTSELKAMFLARLDVVGNGTVVARELGLNPSTAFGWARQVGRRSVRRGQAPMGVSPAWFYTWKAVAAAEGRDWSAQARRPSAPAHLRVAIRHD